MSKTGIELIEEERNEQIKKHGRTPERDVRENHNHQLRNAAMRLIDVPKIRYHQCPQDWNKTIWNKICDKSYSERLIIAGALIAAELDRLNYESHE
jgi:predicted NodU family carbamoyl transferase